MRTRRTPLNLTIALTGLLLAAALTPGCSREEASSDHLREGLARYQAATTPGAAEAGSAGVAPGPAPAPAPAPVPAPAPQHLQVTVLDGEAVAEMDPLGGDSDVYVAVTYAGETQKTAVDEDTIAPQWHDTFVFRYVAGEPLTISLYDADALPSPDELLGTVTIFPDVEGDRSPGGGERLLAFKGGENGIVRVRLELLP